MKNSSTVGVTPFLFTYFLIVSSLSGQPIESSLRNEVEKNVLIFRIRSSSYFDSIQNEITDERKPSFLGLLPDNGFRLKLRFSKLDSMDYPLDEYEVYSITNLNYTYSSDSIEKRKQIFDKSICCNKRFLIAYDSSTRHIKYISGYFYKSMISQDFNLKKNEPNSFYEYLKFRLFNLGVTRIEFKRERKSCFEYVGYSSALRSSVRIVIDKSNIESIQVEQTS